jgi:hypothetical protein
LIDEFLRAFQLVRLHIEVHVYRVFSPLLPAKVLSIDQGYKKHKTTGEKNSVRHGYVGFRAQHINVTAFPQIVPSLDGAKGAKY